MTASSITMQARGVGACTSLQLWEVSMGCSLYAQDNSNLFNTCCSALIGTTLLLLAGTSYACLDCLDKAAFGFSAFKQ